MKLFETSQSDSERSADFSDSQIFGASGHKFAGASDDPVEAARECQKRLNEAVLKLQSETHIVIASLYAICLAFFETPAHYQRFARDPFFQSYAKKKPKADDPFDQMMRNVMRYAYDARNTVKDPRYLAAWRYAQILSRFERMGVAPAQVPARLDNKNVGDDVGVALGGPGAPSRAATDAKKPTSRPARADKATGLHLSFAEGREARLLKQLKEERESVGKVVLLRAKVKPGGKLELVGIGPRKSV